MLVAAASSTALVLCGGGSASATDAQLPDGRAYELVSAADQGIGTVDRVPAIAEDGDALVYLSLFGLPDAGGNTLNAVSIARRSSEGWDSTDITMPVPNASLNLQLAYPFQSDPNFSSFLILTTIPADAQDTDRYRPDIYRWDPAARSSTSLTRGDAGPDSSAGFPLPLGASADLSRVVFQFGGSTLLPGASIPAIYVRDAQGLRLASVLPDGTPAPGGFFVASTGYQTTHEDDAIRSPRGHGLGASVAHGGLHPVSDDATRVFFRTDFPEGNGPGPLYRYDDATRRSVLVSASQRTGSLGVPGNATFLFATHDGSIVYFDSPDRLTDDAPVGGGIYRYDATSGELTELTPDPGQPQGLQLSNEAFHATTSDDGSHIYFVSPAALTPDAVAGAWNVYVWSAAGTRLVAALPEPSYVGSVSRDGRYAVLFTTASIGEHSTNGHQALYEYDASAAKLACISCRPDGAPSEGDANFGDQVPWSVVGVAFTVVRNITDDGAVFFATKDRLLPRDVGAGADIYEYRHGDLSLITGGTSDSDAYLADNTDDGHDVFFMTPERLSGRDTNQWLDLYDARVGGGFPEPRSPSRPCQGDDCQPSPVARPQIPGAGSVSASGPGNVTARPSTSIRRRLSLARLTAAQRKHLARTGRVALTVSVTGGGTVVVRAHANDQRHRLLGTGRRTIKTTASVTTHVTLRLSRAARQRLSRRGHVQMTITAVMQGVGGARSTVVTVTKAPRR